MNMQTTGSKKLVLGIESSCDETAAAIVDGRVVLSNVIASQHELHAEYRGVVPEIASRTHAERLVPIVREACQQAGVTLSDVGLVGVSNRPGLIGSLLVGVSGAKGLAQSLGVPCFGVNHVHAHMFAAVMREGGFKNADVRNAELPALGLVVSGGHTSMFAVYGWDDCEVIGSTIDDAVGEAYDKVGALLGLPYPGGPHVDRLARSGNPGAIEFPIARISPTSLDFSFSGLKTAALYAWQGVPAHPSRPAKGDARPHVAPSMEDLCASFQFAAARTLRLKLERAIEAARSQGLRFKSLVAGGGVMANGTIRAAIEGVGQEHGLGVLIAPRALCLDNAAMIAGLAHQLVWVQQAATPPLSFATFATLDPSDRT
jgi:N6-L-threonylcarbamoyladenine synthase